MLTCLIMGDSIAIGAAHAINARLSNPCAVLARQGATAAQAASWRVALQSYGAAIISLGSNDQADHTLERSLLAIRTRILAGHTIWLLPYSRRTAIRVTSIAVRFGDETLDLWSLPSKDGVHPLSYGQLADALLKPGAAVRRKR
jgi:hypothetical protein